MSRKRKDDAAELEPAQDVPDEAGAGAADDAGAAGAGQANEAQAGDAAAGDEKPADAAPAGEVPGAADADAHAANAAQPEAEAEGKTPELNVAVMRDGLLSVHLPGGSVQWLAIDEVEWLAKAAPEAAIRYVVHDDRVVWPELDDAWLTLEELDELSFGGQGDLSDGTIAPRNRIDINVLAAYSAASMAFGTTEEDSTTLPRFDVSWLGERGDRAQAGALCAAAFLRRNSAMPVQPETLVIHLRRSGHGDAPAAEGRVAVAWRVFFFALAELDALDQAQAEAARQTELASGAAKGPRPARREDLAMTPADPNPLTDLGRRLQGRG